MAKQYISDEGTTRREGLVFMIGEAQNEIWLLQKKIMAELAKIAGNLETDIDGRQNVDVSKLNRWVGLHNGLQAQALALRRLFWRMEKAG